jgi:hypothetical protein
LKVTSIVTVDDCVDTSITREVRFDSPLTAEAIRSLSRFGDLRYHRSFTRPFFHLVVDDRVHIKGIEGNSHCLLILDRDDVDGSLDRVRHMFESVGDGTASARYPLCKN